MAISRHTISLDAKIAREGVKRAAALGYRSFSAYCEHLIREDVEKRPAHVTVREEAGQYRSQEKAKRPA